MVSPGPDGQWLDYATELPYPSIEACVDHQVQRSLRNLGLETIDLMQLHGAPEGELFDRMTEALRRHVDAGCATMAKMYMSMVAGRPITTPGPLLAQ